MAMVTPLVIVGGLPDAVNLIPSKERGCFTVGLHVCPWRVKLGIPRQDSGSTRSSRSCSVP